MKIKDVRNFSDEELHIELERLREQIFSLRAQAVTEKLQDPTQLKKAKRDIARLLTVVNERSREAVKAQEIA